MDKGKILESWKEIAAHLHRNIRTCQMWEQELGLPIHRLDGSPKARVFAYEEELDRWLEEKLHEGESPDAEMGAGRGKGKPGAFGGTIFGINKAYFWAGLGCLAIAAAAWLLIKPPPAKVYDSIAVLPLEILSKEPGQDYYSEGLAEELITRLFQVGSLRVAEFGPVRDYRTAKKTYKDIYRDLGVKAVLDSAVFRIGDRIRINAKLVDAETERPIWAASYERDVADVLALQAEIAQAIVHEIRVRLTPQERTRLASAPKVVPEAVNAHFMGRQLMRAGNLSKMSVAELLDSERKYFQLAIDLDPEFAPAYFDLATVYAFLHHESLMRYEDVIVKAEEALDKGLRLDPDSAQAHLTRGMVLWSKWRWADASAQLKQAVQIEPGNPSARWLYADALRSEGRFEEAVTMAERGDRLNLALRSNGSYARGCVLVDAKRYDEAIGIFRDIDQREPGFPAVHAMLGVTYVLKGSTAEAIDEAEKTLALLPPLEKGSNFLAASIVLGWAGRRDKALKLLDDYLAFNKGKPIDSYAVSAFYAVLNDKDEAFKWLDRAFEEHAFWMIWLKIDPALENLRSDPRFKACLKRAGFET